MAEKSVRKNEDILIAGKTASYTYLHYQSGTYIEPQMKWLAKGELPQASIIILTIPLITKERACKQRN